MAMITLTIIISDGVGGFYASPRRALYASFVLQTLRKGLNLSIMSKMSKETSSIALELKKTRDESKTIDRQNRFLEKRLEQHKVEVW